MEVGTPNLNTERRTLDDAAIQFDEEVMNNVEPAQKALVGKVISDTILTKEPSRICF